MMIQLKSFTKDAASRTKGLQLKTKLEHAIKEERNISVDFDGIDKFASPFFNNSFSALGIQYGFGTIEKIELLNISDNGKLVFDSSMKLPTTGGWAYLPLAGGLFVYSRKKRRKM